MVQKIMGCLQGDVTRHEVRSTVDAACCGVQATLSLQRTSGGVFRWPVIPLQDLLPHCVGQCAGFRAIFEQTVSRCRPSPAQPWHIVLYCDEITPGNPLRPDNKRKVTAFYASFLEFKDALRCEECWLLLGVLRSSLLKDIAGGMSAVVRQLLRQMLLGPRNIRTAGALCGSTLVFGRFHRILGDEAAVKAALATKGASGLKPCLHCKNVVAKAADGRQDLVDCDVEGYLVGIACTDPRLFDPMSDADWHAAFDLLAGLAGDSRRKKELEDMQKAVGLNWEPRGLLGDADLRPLVSVTKSVRDPMHMLLSNGAMNVELVLLLKAWAETTPEFKFHMLRDFCAARWCFPRARKKVKVSDVFSDGRLAASLPGNSLKAGASEVLSAYAIVRHFVEIVMEPTGKIAPQRASFQALCRVVDGMVLLKQRCEPRRLRDFDAACAEWVRLHVGCYGAEFVRPKTHFVLHLGAQPRADQFFADCFTHERKHQAIKAEADYVRNTVCFEKSVLKSVHLAQLRELSRIQASGLVGTTVTSSILAPALGHTCEVANAMRVDFVPYGVGDVLFCGEIAVQISACIKASEDFRCIVRRLLLHDRPSPTTSRWAITEELYMLDPRDGEQRPALCWYTEDGVLTALGP